MRVSSLVPSKKSQINFQKKKKICSIFGAKIQNYMKLILLVRMHIETFLMILKHYDNQFLTPSVKGPQWGCIGFAFCLTFCVARRCELRRDWGLISSLCLAFVEALYQRENAHSLSKVFKREKRDNAIDGTKSEYYTPWHLPIYITYFSTSNRTWPTEGQVKQYDM